MNDLIIDVQQLFWDALKTKNAQLFEHILASDFVAISSTQPNQSRAEFIKTLTSFPIEITSMTAENLQAHHFENVGILTGIQIAHLRMPDGSSIINKIAITNVFRYDGDHWLLVLAHPVEIT